MGNSFFDHFKFAMNSVGLPVPTTLFGTATTAAATIQTLSSIVATYGTKVTVAEALLAVPAGTGAATVLVQVGTITGALAVSFYAGACIGALAYALGQWTSEKVTTMSNIPGPEFLQVARQNHIQISEELSNYLSGYSGGSFRSEIAMRQALSGNRTLA